MNHHDDSETFPKKPVNKATMDGPQEEFIDPYASIVEPDQDPGGERVDAAQPVPILKSADEGKDPSRH